MGLKKVSFKESVSAKSFVFFIIVGLSCRFISHLTATCEPIFKLLKKDQVVRWNDECQTAFERIKEYLQEPPILMHPFEGRPLILYLTVLDNSMGVCWGSMTSLVEKSTQYITLAKSLLTVKHDTHCSRELAVL